DCAKYILTYHKLFDGLINNCTAYDNGECSQCENGYQNNGTSCRDIRESTCDTYSGTTCTKCTTENLLVDNECVSKTSLHCQTSDGVSCSECESGNLLKNGSCSSLADNHCYSTTDGINCSKCLSTYYNKDNEGVCEPINVDNCTEANSGGSCTACSTGYQLAWINHTNSCYARNNISCSSISGNTCTMSSGGTAYKVGNLWVTSVGNTSYSNVGMYNGLGDDTYPDYYEGAKKVCADKGMTLASADDYQKIYDNKDSYPDASSLTGQYRAIDENVWHDSIVYDFDLGQAKSNTRAARLGVLCVAK
ncbi:hypothetical protein IJ732_01640, partial [bacterium]|nr:hypothetical protein [bacterium]